MALSQRLARAQEILGHEFNNKVLLRAALTHPSAVEGQPVSASYERLEFLGDSILGAVVARSLFESNPSMSSIGASETSTARLIRFCSSRTLPGHR